MGAFFLMAPSVKHSCSVCKKGKVGPSCYEALFCKKILYLWLGHMARKSPSKVSFDSLCDEKMRRS